MSAVKLEDARRIIAACEKKAKEIGQPMNIAVADEGGNIVAHVRMDNAWIGSIDISMKKAYTARTFRRSSGDFANSVKGNATAGALFLTNIVAAQGALPIKVGDDVIGAIGVSGAPGGDKDEACAKAGLDKVSADLK